MTVTTQPNIGSHASDGFSQGPQFNANNGKIWPYSKNAPVGRGSFNSPIRVYDIKPSAASYTNIAAAQTVGSAGYVQLVTTTGEGVTVTTFANQFALQTDCPRTFQIIGVAGTTSVNFTFYGVDEGNNPVVEQIAGPTGATVVRTKKPMAYLLRVYADGNTTQNISIGYDDAFGLPYVAVDRNYITPYWGGYQDDVFPVVVQGTATMDGASPPTVGVPSANVNAASLAFVSYNTGLTACGNISAPSSGIIPGAQFVINGNANGDVSTVNYNLFRQDGYCGTATLAAGTVTVSNDNVTATSLIFLSYNTMTNPGFLEIGAQSAGSFTITSSDNTDTSTVNYYIVEPSLYAGTATLVNGVATVLSPNVLNTAFGDSRILVSRNVAAGATQGYLSAPVASITNATSFVIRSLDATAAVETDDQSTVNWMILNPTSQGVFTLPDDTDPATISTGAVRGTYRPSSPADGNKRLTISMYVRATDAVANFVGLASNDTSLLSTEENLYGVTNYTDDNH